jgi:hypothetical protein
VFDVVAFITDGAFPCAQEATFFLLAAVIAPSHRQCSFMIVKPFDLA